MPCTANTNPRPTTPATVSPSAASAPTAAAGLSPASITASLPANFCVTGAAGNTTPAPSAHALALSAIFDVRLLARSLYSSLAENPNPTREQVAEWVGKAGQMHRHAEEAIGALVNLYTELIVP